MQSFQVEGMDCDHCAHAVSAAIRQIDPGAVVRVDLRTGRVEVDSDAAADRLAAAIRGEGYGARALAA